MQRFIPHLRRSWFFQDEAGETSEGIAALHEFRVLAEFHDRLTQCGLKPGDITLNGLPSLVPVENGVRHRKRHRIIDERRGMGAGREMFLIEERVFFPYTT